MDAGREIDRLKAAGPAREAVLGELFDEQRARLRRMIALRMDRRLQGRVDASDVLQEAWLEVSARLGDYLQDPRMPFHLWVRFITGQKLLSLHRFHIGTQKRDATRQVSVGHARGPEASSIALAEELLAQGTTPTGAAVRTELQTQLIEALEQMEPLDREVLVLRHFEQLSNADVAAVLDIGKTAASNRYVRALGRLRDVLATDGDADA